MNSILICAILISVTKQQVTRLNQAPTKQSLFYCASPQWIKAQLLSPSPLAGLRTLLDSTLLGNHTLLNFCLRQQGREGHFLQVKEVKVRQSVENERAKDYHAKKLLSLASFMTAFVPQDLKAKRLPRQAGGKGTWKKKKKESLKQKSPSTFLLSDANILGPGGMRGEIEPLPLSTHFFISLRRNPSAQFSQAGGAIGCACVGLCARLPAKRFPFGENSPQRFQGLKEVLESQ